MYLVADAKVEDVNITNLMFYKPEVELSVTLSTVQPVY